MVHGEDGIFQIAVAESACGTQVRIPEKVSCKVLGGAELYSPIAENNSPKI